MDENIKDDYVAWLNEYAWNFACSLNVRDGIGRKGADRRWREWIARLEENEGHPLSWARMAEVGKIAGQLHFHGVVAGIRRTQPRKAELMWLAGDAQVQPYKSVGWLQYQLKTMETEENYDFDHELLPQHKRADWRAIRAASEHRD